MYATCETTGCENAFQPIPIPTAAVGVICGPCGAAVTNITDIKPTEGTVLPEWISEMLTQPSSDA